MFQDFFRSLLVTKTVSAVFLWTQKRLRSIGLGSKVGALVGSTGVGLYKTILSDYIYTLIQPSLTHALPILDNDPAEKTKHI